MLNRNKRCLYLHIGPPKTGTTSLQMYLIQNQAEFTKNGVGLADSFGNGNHFLLGEFLLKMDAKEYFLPGYELGSFDEKQFFPLWPLDFSSYIISSENMEILGEKGVEALINYASQNNARIEILYSIRDPIDALWSRWVQFIKIFDMDWIGFIDQARILKTGFLSTSLMEWSKKKGCIIRFIDYQPKNLIGRFLEKINLAHLYVPNSDLIVNKSLNIIEAMYLNFIVRQVLISQKNNRDDSQLFSGISQRFLLELVENSNPSHEAAKKYQQQCLNESILGGDSYINLSQYLEAWIEDAESFFQNSSGSLGPKDEEIIKNAIAKARAELNIIQNDSGSYKQFPQRNYLENLPVDSQIYGIARLIEEAIYANGRLHQKIQNARINHA